MAVSTDGSVMVLACADHGQCDYIAIEYDDERNGMLAVREQQRLPAVLATTS